jgi:hypothetical protein
MNPTLPIPLISGAIDGYAVAVGRARVRTFRTLSNAARFAIRVNRRINYRVARELENV